MALANGHITVPSVQRPKGSLRRHAGWIAAGAAVVGASVLAFVVIDASDDAGVAPAGIVEYGPGLAEHGSISAVEHRDLAPALDDGATDSSNSLVERGSISAIDRRTGGTTTEEE